MRLSIRPTTLREANAFVASVHRHHRPVTGHRFAVAVEDETGRLRAVGIAGRPVSRHLDQAGHLEVLRVASDGATNACSLIYGALARAGAALGYPRHKIITYTLITEPGTSLRAAGWWCAGEAGGGTWDRPERPRQGTFPTMTKQRWHAAREDQP